ncbi:hypothetical protein DL93DRAFT_2129025 [Clavulina sp. PMI_390]|nr:hypothetical protein DL93DRAFT_2129025 [Clavulina sp. PMI_390]
MTSSFPFLKTTLKADLDGPPRKASDVLSLPIPANTPVPELPLPPRDPKSFAPGYTVSSHIFPGAYPRYSFLEPKRWLATSIPIINDAPPDSASKATRAKWALNKRDALLEKSLQIYRARTQNVPQDGPGEKEGLGPVTWNTVNRYARVSKPTAGDKRTGLTVISFHANGLHKETFEPTYRLIISLCDQPTSNVRVDEFWSLEAANTADGALINGDVFGDYQDGIDHFRDTLNFLEHYLPQAPLASFPVHLERHDKVAGYPTRFVVGLGHSFGGAVLSNAACCQPSVFRSLTLIEPVLLQNADLGLIGLALATLSRRESWKSREQAKSLLEQHPLFMTWTPEALDLYVRYALRDAPGGGVTLKMSRFDEGAMLSHATSYVETWALMETLPTSVRLRWITAEYPGLGSVETVHNLVWLRKGNTSNIIVPDGMHFLVQQKPEVVGKCLLPSTPCHSSLK